MIRSLLSKNSQARKVLATPLVNNQRYNYSTLVLCEHNKQKLSNATLSVLSAAGQLKNNVTAVVAGTSADKAVAEKIASTKGVSSVVFVESPELEYQSAEAVQKALEQVIGNASEPYTHIMAAHTIWGKNVLPRLGAVYNKQPITDVIAIDGPKNFVRPVYANDALTSVESLDDQVIMTTRTAAFDRVEETQDPVEIVQESLSTLPERAPKFVKAEISQSDRPELTDASIVISGGRGMKNGENFNILEEFADQVGAAVGASRAAVDAGWVPNDMQVGQTGKIVAPDLYIACGISGQIQHVAGMKDSKCIVAINKDEEAPFFQIADYGLAADLFKVVPELTEIVKADRAN